jgi:hypothetical protein
LKNRHRLQRPNALACQRHECLVPDEFVDRDVEAKGQDSGPVQAKAEAETEAPAPA